MMPYAQSEQALSTSSSPMSTEVSMLPETKMMLRDFYGPYVLELQNMFNNTALAWW